MRETRENKDTYISNGAQVNICLLMMEPKHKTHQNLYQWWPEPLHHFQHISTTPNQTTPLEIIRNKVSRRGDEFLVFSLLSLQFVFIFIIRADVDHSRKIGFLRTSGKIRGTPDGVNMTDGSFRKPECFFGIYLNRNVPCILSINSARCKEHLANGYQPLKRYLFSTISFQYGLRVEPTDICRIQYPFYRSRINSSQN